jgi:hypothetical protein
MIDQVTFLGYMLVYFFVGGVVSYGIYLCEWHGEENKGIPFPFVMIACFWPGVMLAFMLEGNEP